MPTMQQVLEDNDKRKALVEDCLQLIDDEVDSKSGLSGVAIKTGYKVVKGFKPGFIRNAVDGLIDEFAERLQPYATEAKEKGQPVGTYFVSVKSQVSQALLGITDERASRSRHKVVKNTYLKLRPAAEKHVEAAIPGVGRLIEKYTG